MKMNELQEKLEAFGLSDNQALVYLSLLEHGMSKAGRIPKYTGLKRALSYKILDQLIEMGFVEKHGTDAIAFYAPLSPAKIRTLVNEKVEEVHKLKESFDEIEGALKSKFNLLSGKPSVQYFEGIEGVEKMYDMVNEDREDIYLIRSPLDNSYPELIPLIETQIQKQVAENITTHAITPFEKKNTKKSVKEYDEKNKVKRCIVEADTLQIPAQILIFGKKVAFTSFKDGIITSIVQDVDVSSTMRILFKNIWENNQTTHKKFMKEILGK